MYFCVRVPKLRGMKICLNLLPCSVFVLGEEDEKVLYALRRKDI